MIAVDTNILVYAHREDNPWHDKAKKALEAVSKSLWCIPWPCVHEFLSIVTHPKIYNTPTPIDLAIKAMEGFQRSAKLRLLLETENHWRVLTEIINHSHVVGPRIHDARIVALCIQHAVDELWTADRDFSRFRELRTVNPLI